MFAHVPQTYWPSEDRRPTITCAYTPRTSVRALVPAEILNLAPYARPRDHARLPQCIALLILFLLGSPRHRTCLGDPLVSVDNGALSTCYFDFNTSFR